MLWDMARDTGNRLGPTRGIYYFGLFLADVIGPICREDTLCKDVTGLVVLFPVGERFMVVAVFFMLKVKRGEPELTEERG